MKMNNVIGSIKFGAKKYSPELLLGGALITGTACVATTVIATTKAENIKARYVESKDSIVLCEMSEDEKKKAVKKLYAEVAIEYAKRYAVPATLFIATTGLVFASYKIQKNRQIALSSALASATLAYSSLLGRVQRGAEAGLTAQEILDGIDVKKNVDEETGEVTYEKVQGEKLGAIYDFRFDKYATSWEPDKYCNLCTLNAEQQWANDRLTLDGYLFLNDVLDRLGLPRTKAGQVVGWKRDGNGDGYVDFGIVDCANYDNVSFDSNAYDLSFNIDGDILTDF